ncbi:hypothetical protein BU25DRAFT_415113 [Macroventuria anomochaeta]|uniref:Uncharacterized protein n=1 Tax=Macroventuria anomochaeta TaxID=301207 RepID=A0ACB6RL74_9PLEO|nr:uncharacterized protein BU25DRAFT_415113 [Macroventuria anomochaeta]KAF2622621.1 hypothetical protein BU25DRAFT_415113 [Macroventuria anomochaeta]
MSVRSKVALSDRAFCIPSYLTSYDLKAADFLYLLPPPICICSQPVRCIGSHHLLSTLCIQTPPSCFHHSKPLYLFNFHVSYHKYQAQPLGPFELLNMCTIHYIVYTCQHWIPQPQRPSGEILRICRQAEEERLGFACPETQRDHEVIDRSQGVCRDCMWRQVLR